MLQVGNLFPTPAPWNVRELKLPARVKEIRPWTEQRNAANRQRSREPLICREFPERPRRR
jgi:hypothetical protein